MLLEALIFGFKQINLVNLVIDTIKIIFLD